MPEEIIRFIRNPEAYSESSDLLATLTRPHLTLLLTFLEMLEQVRKQSGQLTEAHLDMVYKRMLGFRPEPPRADRLHLLFEVMEGEKSWMLQKGTILEGGRDAGGNDRLYALEHDLLVGPGRIVQVRNELGYEVCLGRRRVKGKRVRVLRASPQEAEAEVVASK